MFKRLFLILVILLIPVVFVVGYAAGQYNTRDTSERVNEDRLWELVNAWKNENDGYMYQPDDLLCGLATRRLKEIKNNWSHDGFTDVISNNFQGWGENLAKDQSSEQQVLDEWLNSASHSANLKEKFTSTCIRCEDNHCVQLFAKQ